MGFPITNLLNKEACERRLLAHFHPEGLKSPRCGAGVAAAHVFRTTKRSRLTVYRSNRCAQPDTLYRGTVCPQRRLAPPCGRMGSALRAAIVNTDEYPRCHALDRRHVTAPQGPHEWARAQDGDGFYEGHGNTTEGLWTDVRKDLRLFKGVHKRYLDIAICEFRRNLKRISPVFIAQFVAFHSFYT